MIQVKKEGVILSKTTIDFESQAVLNPAIIREGKLVYLFYRAISEANYSTIGFCLLNGPLKVINRYNHPVLMPIGDRESKGIEDPRIVKIDERYYLTYTAFDGFNALGALATSLDLKTFERHGLIVPLISFADFKTLAQHKGKLNVKYSRFAHDKTSVVANTKLLVWDKDVIFFPRRINNRLHFIHRIKPDIQIASINEIWELNELYWQNYLLDFNKHILLSPKYDHEISYVGGGCPPIETTEGWLVIYHGVHDTATGYVYSACAALLDLENPKKEIARLPYALFKPDTAWELSGKVDNVCFPSGTAVFEDILYIYYGAADEKIACASVSLSGIIAELLIYRLKSTQKR